MTSQEKLDSHDFDISHSNITHYSWSYREILFCQIEMMYKCITCNFKIYGRQDISVNSIDYYRNGIIINDVLHLISKQPEINNIYIGYLIYSCNEFMIKNVME